MSRAVSLAARVEQYLAERRRLGFDLRSMRYGLDSLVEHVRKTRHRGALTIEVMAAWARQARQGAGTNATWARRLRLLRPFTRWLQQFEPATQVPDEAMFGPIPGRVTPHIYHNEELVALLEAAGRIGPPTGPRGAVMQTLFGLLACTGMRISEALALVDADVDLKSGGNSQARWDWRRHRTPVATASTSKASARRATNERVRCWWRLPGAGCDGSRPAH